MTQFTKKQKRHLRELAGKAYELELGHQLKLLRDQFKRWESGEISVWQLSDLIHKFHDGESRDLYKFYAYGDDTVLQVIRAIRNGFLSLDDIEESCREAVQSRLNFYFRPEDDQDEE